MYLIVSVAVVRDQSLFGVSPDLVLFTDLIDGVEWLRFQHSDLGTVNIVWLLFAQVSLRLWWDSLGGLLLASEAELFGVLGSTLQAGSSVCLEWVYLFWAWIVMVHVASIDIDIWSRIVSHEARRRDQILILTWSVSTAADIFSCRYRLSLANESYSLGQVTSHLGWERLVLPIVAKADSIDWLPYQLFTRHPRLNILITRVAHQALLDLGGNWILMLICGLRRWYLIGSILCSCS